MINPNDTWRESLFFTKLTNKTIYDDDDSNEVLECRFLCLFYYNKNDLYVHVNRLEEDEEKKEWWGKLLNLISTNDHKLMIKN